MINTVSTESNLSGLNKEDFQKDINNKKTDLFILKNAQGMEVAVTNYGCAILSIMVPDKNGKYANVILGHDSIDHVVNSPEPFLNTTIGRYGNRIAKGKFTLYGEEHNLTINNGPNSLHGGPTGFHARVWDAVQPSYHRQGNCCQPHQPRLLQSGRYCQSHPYGSEPHHNYQR